MAQLHNAAQQIQNHTAEELTPDELQRAVLQVFGFKRKTKRLQKHLMTAFRGWSTL